jgi:hypothetical protein
MNTGSNNLIYIVDTNDEQTSITLEIQSPAICTASGCETNIHNQLDGLQGGSLNERYHLTKYQYLNLIAYSLASPLSIPLDGSNPQVLSNWQADYYPIYGNANFKVQLKDGSGNLNDQPIYPTRIIDRTSTPIQTAVSFDTTGFPQGQIIIYYSSEQII